MTRHAYPPTLREWKEMDAARRAREADAAERQARRELADRLFSTTPFADRRESVKAASFARAIEEATEACQRALLPVPGCPECEDWDRKCPVHYRADMARLKGRRAPGRGPGSPSRECLRCGVSFLAPSGRGRPPLTCSEECRREWRQVRDSRRHAATRRGSP